MNTGELLLEPETAEWRVLSIQTKLHRWAGEERARRFDDLFTWSQTRRSSWSRGAGSGATPGPVRRASTG